jgi:hypothetical protein
MKRNKPPVSSNQTTIHAEDSRARLLMLYRHHPPLQAPSPTSETGPKYLGARARATGRHRQAIGLATNRIPQCGLSICQKSRVPSYVMAKCGASSATSGSRTAPTQCLCVWKPHLSWHLTSRRAQPKVVSVRALTTTKMKSAPHSLLSSRWCSHNIKNSRKSDSTAQRDRVAASFSPRCPTRLFHRAVP